jgi:superfamily II DNA/RNA helicase
MVLKLFCGRLLQRCMDVGEAEPPRMPDVLRHFYVHVAAQQPPHHLLPKLHAAVKPIGSTVVFTRDVDHAREVVQYLRDHRFRAAVLTPAIPKERRERAALLRKVKRNQVKARPLCAFAMSLADANMNSLHSDFEEF